MAKMLEMNEPLTSRRAPHKGRPHQGPMNVQKPQAEFLSASSARERIARPVTARHSTIVRQDRATPTPNHSTRDL